MKQFLLSVSLLIGVAVNAQDCSDLFISEYVEGWSNNKALEIYNPTDQSIDLSGYLVQRYSNGSTSAGAQQSVQLSGTIEAYGTYVAVIDKRDPNGTGQEAPVWDSLQEKADGFYCPDYNVSNAMYFNGNDAVVLAKGSVSDLGNVIAVDIFGKIGEDPDMGNEYDGWTSDFPFVGAGVVVTTDHSMIRKSTILKGETNPQISFFDPLDEYDSIPPVVFDQSLGYEVGNWESLGTHECECETASVTSEEPVKVSIYPNPSENGEFIIRVNNGIEKLEVINALGQNVLTENNLDAVSKINVSSKTGVYFVKILTVDGRVTSRRVIIK
ncbi:MAG: hypothetical protein COA32_07260 [Fluviicola sp.]|nr:MAG: hypothetical protein COA32_07260 [Fluviicola sp.]